LKTWFDTFGDGLAEVDVEGDPAFVLRKDVDELAATKPTNAVRLLGRFDQYVLGPSTDDGHVVPATRRAEVSRQSGWISPVVIAGGFVRGTWELNGDLVSIGWFREAGRPPPKALERVGWLAAMLGPPLLATITAADPSDSLRSVSLDSTPCHARQRG